MNSTATAVTTEAKHSSSHRAQLCAQYISAKKGQQLRILDVSALSSLTDYLVLATGTSDRHVQAVAEAVHLGLKKDHSLQPLAVEGMETATWVLLDYGDVMVHIFQQATRQFYDLDGLWCEAPELPWQPAEGS